jgi:hypothetical protein
MKFIIWILLTESAVVLALIIIYLIIRIWILLRKYVVTLPQLTLALAPVTPPGQYDHGATVNFSGVDLSDIGPPAVPAPGATINLSLEDAAGTETQVGSVQTQEDGSFAGSFVVPADAAPGDATLTATDPATGATATATFTLKRSKCRMPYFEGTRNGRLFHS